MTMGRRTRTAVALATVGALGPIAAPSTAAAALPTVNGSGSTFAQIAIQQWQADVAAKYGLQVNFQPNGSTAGRTQFALKQVDFTSSDVSYRFPAGLGNEPLPNFAYTYMPLVAGGTAVLYNVKDRAGRPITDLQVSGKLIVRLFTSEGSAYWDDPAIVAENPQLRNRLPHTPIRSVVRSGGSGTTSVFTAYLYNQDPQGWAKYMRGTGNQTPADDCTSRLCGPTDVWPTDRNYQDIKDGSDGVANQVKSYTNTIGYAEYAYALQRGVPVARVRNHAGNYVLPTPCNQAIALTHADRNKDGTYNLDRVYVHPHPSAYPVSSYNYVIVPASGSDPGKGATMSRFILYSITDGQRKAAPLGYSPLPTNLIQQGFNALNDVPGHTAIPGNPAQWGQFYESLTLPDGTRCGTAGKTGSGGGVSGGAGQPTGASGGGANGAKGPGKNGPSAAASGAAGATAGPGAANQAVSPTQAAAAASNVANAMKSSGVPWQLYLAALALFSLVFLPAPIAALARRLNRRQA